MASLSVVVALFLKMPQVLGRFASFGMAVCEGTYPAAADNEGNCLHLPDEGANRQDSIRVLQGMINDSANPSIPVDPAGDYYYQDSA